MYAKMTSAFLSVAAISCMSVLAGPPSGGPGGGSSGSFTYDSFMSVTTNSDCTLVREGTLFGYTDGLGSSVTGGSSVSALAHGVFAGNADIASVDLSSSTVTEIPSDCFAGCTSLVTVTLPSCCTTIGANAFAGCTALATFDAAGVTTVGADAFSNCSSLTGVPSALASAGAYSYSGTGIASVDVSGVTLGEGAFAGCESLVSATTGSTLSAAAFSGCSSLATADWSHVTDFGEAALAGIAADTLTISSSATLGAYSFAADAATVETTLTGSSLPEYAQTAFLGREMSYTTKSGAVARIEANDLVQWLEGVADGSVELTSATVVQPESYATVDLETWLSDSSNLSAIVAYCYGDGTEEGDVLSVDGSSFTFMPSDKTSVRVVPLGTYDLNDDFLESNLSLVGPDAESGAYTATAADGEATSCFVRLSFTKGW